MQDITRDIVVLKKGSRTHSSSTYIRPESCSIAAALQAMLDNNGNAG
jgi:hypothetical protein